MAKNCSVMSPLGVPKCVPDLYNDTGATLAQGELSVVGDLVAICTDGAGVASTAVGGFDFGECIVRILTAAMKNGEATFNTDNQPVYFDPSGKKFSDTETAGYYKIGQLKNKKGSNGFCDFIKFEKAELVTT